MTDVQRAVDAALQYNSQLALLQCNTNYTASLDNFKYIQLNVLKTFREMYPDMVLGLSDHTPGYATVLGAVALGARIVEKHFTDDIGRIGPDHAFSMDCITWREMVDRTRELENSLGTGVKQVEGNEKETEVLQRRSIRIKVDLPQGATLTQDNIIMLRPCPKGALPPYEADNVIGKQTRHTMKAGDHLTWSDIG